jgi:hypothetical protein
VHKHVDRVRAAAEWIDTAVETGRTDLDEEFAHLLLGE